MKIWDRTQNKIQQTKRYYKKISKFFHGTRVPWETWFHQTWVPKKWYIPTYFLNSDRLQHSLQKDVIWLFSQAKFTKDTFMKNWKKVNFKKGTCNVTGGANA